MGGSAAVTIVRFGQEHLEPFRALAADPLVLRFTRFPDPLPEGFAESWLARYEAGRAAGTMEGFAILAGGVFAGIAVVPEIDRARNAAELGYAVSPEARGRGVATAALELLTQWAFNEAGIERAELQIGAANEASKHVARACDYRYLHTEPHVRVKPGRIEDSAHWVRERAANST